MMAGSWEHQNEPNSSEHFPAIMFGQSHDDVIVNVMLCICLRFMDSKWQIHLEIH